MKAAYTVCTISYLPQTILLGKSLVKHNPDYTFFIGIFDKKERIPAEANLHGFEIIPIEDLAIPEINDMIEIYNYFEIICALKPFFGIHLFRTFPQLETLFYFDCDIFVYNSLQIAEDLLSKKGIVLTHHCLTPLPDDGLEFSEQGFLNAGIYNAGFVGFNRSVYVNKNSFLYWWRNKLVKLGRVDLAIGLCADQLWVNMAPVYFENIEILKNPGYNMGPWNFHERTLLQEGNKKLVLGPGEQKNPLVFFHFSGFNYKTRNIACKYQNRYELENRPDLQLLYEEYADNWQKEEKEGLFFVINYYDEPLDKMRKLEKRNAELMRFYKEKHSKPWPKLKALLKSVVSK